MGDHSATPATQTEHPWRAAFRTGLQTGLPALAAALWLIPAVIQEIVDGFGQAMPDDMRLWLLAVAAGITTMATVLARVMAMPGVVEWTRKYLPWLAPDRPTRPTA